MMNQKDKIKIYDSSECVEMIENKIKKGGDYIAEGIHNYITLFLLIILNKIDEKEQVPESIFNKLYQLAELFHFEKHKIKECELIYLIKNNQFKESSLLFENNELNTASAYNYLLTLYGINTQMKDYVLNVLKDQLEKESLNENEMEILTYNIKSLETGDEDQNEKL